MCTVDYLSRLAFGSPYESESIIQGRHENVGARRERLPRLRVRHMVKYCASWSVRQVAGLAIEHPKIGIQSCWEISFGDVLDSRFICSMRDARCEQISA